MITDRTGLHSVLLPLLIGSVSTTTTVTKTSQICIFDNEKQQFFARFARAFFIFGHLAEVLVLSMTCNDLFCSSVDDVSIGGFSRYVIAAMLVDENKTSLISSFCSSTSNCTLQHCHLCLQRLVANHLYHDKCSIFYSYL